MKIMAEHVKGQNRGEDSRKKIRIGMKIRTDREATEVLREAREVWSRKRAWIWAQQKKYPKGIPSSSSVDPNRI